MEKIVKCPLGGEEINGLYYHDKIYRSLDFSLRDGKAWYDEQTTDDIGCEGEYVCGNCGEVVADNEEKAIEILKND